MNAFRGGPPRPESRRPCPVISAQGHQKSQRGFLARFLPLAVGLATVVFFSLACGGAEDEFPEAAVAPEVLQAQRFAAHLPDAGQVVCVERTDGFQRGGALRTQEPFASSSLEKFYPRVRRGCEATVVEFTESAQVRLQRAMGGA